MGKQWKQFQTLFLGASKPLQMVIAVMKLKDASQMTIISSTAGRNPSEEMEWPSWSIKESEMQYLDAISKTKE